MGIHRSDYMVHVDSTGGAKRGLLQVEFNTISVSFACLSAKVGQLHK